MADIDQCFQKRLKMNPFLILQLRPEVEAADDYFRVIVGGGPGCVSDPAEKNSPVEARIEAVAMGLLPEITVRDLPFMGCC